MSDSQSGALRRRSVRGAALTFGAQGARFVLQFGAQIVLAHYLLPAQFGLVAMVAPVLSLVQVFNDLGLTQATVQRPDITQGELSALFWVNLAISICLAGLLALAAPLVAWFYQEPRLVGITAACGSLLVLSGAAAQQIALMNRHMRFATLATIDVSCAAAACAAGLAAAMAGAGAWSLVVMQAANALTILVLAWCLSDWRPHRPRREPGLASLLAFGGHVTGFNTITYLENNLAPILIGRLHGTAALGLYDRAYKLVIVPWWQILLPVDRVADTLLARLQTDAATYRRAHLLMLQGLLLVAAPGLLWAATQADLLVPTVLGPAWAAAAPIVGTLALATMAVPLTAGASWLFVSQGRVRQQLRCGLITGAILLVSILAGLHWGPLGVARAYLAAAPLLAAVPLAGATSIGPVRLADVTRAALPVGFGLAVASAALLTLRAESALALAGTLVLAYVLSAAAMLCLPAGRSALAGLWSLRRDLR